MKFAYLFFVSKQIQKKTSHQFRAKKVTAGVDESSNLARKNKPLGHAILFAAREQVHSELAKETAANLGDWPPFAVEGGLWFAVSRWFD